jgi:hypothetical protein
MNKTNIGNLKVNDEVLITVYNPPLKARIADMYYLPFEQVPMDEPSLIQKYYGKNVPIVEVFIDGKIRSFISEVVKKV